MEKYNYEDFYEMVWDSISEKLVPNSFIEKNVDLVREVTFDFYNIYDKSENITIKVVVKMLESVFFNYITYGINCDAENDNRLHAYDGFYDND